MRRVGQRLGPRLLRAGLAAPVARSLEAGPSISGAAAASYVGCSAAWNSRGFAADGGGGGGSDDARAARRRSEAWEEVGRLSEAASEIADDRGSAEARKKLKEELPHLEARFGADDPALGLLYNQLALWSFADGQYGDAVDAARAAQQVWIKESGEDSPAAAFHGIRLGMALAADGHPEEAFPLLEKGLSVAVDNYNSQVGQLEGVMPMAEDPEAAAQDASEADDAAMAARAEQQRVSIGMLEQLGRALQEAKFYRALSFIGVTGRELNASWEERGAGAVFFLEQEMSDAVTDMLRWVSPDHPTVECALREHGRLLAQCTKEGLRKLADDLQIHKQRLDDLVAEARNGKDG